MFDRTFTDPFTGEVLDDPTRKTYEVTLSIGDNPREKTTIDTLAEGRLTQAQAKEKILGRPMMAAVPARDLTIHKVKKVDEDAAGAPPGPF